MFHDLSDAYEQGAFDAIGDASWATPAGATSFRPPCSASVHQDDPDWQHTSFAGPEGMRDWLAWACDNSTARAEGYQGLASSATRTLVLVICNGRPFHPDTRTVTVLVAG
ncbi:hypothetical protein [Olsenella sp. Marseille-P4559]|jgi:hypothetical protein|uniref:hypothetical protein n=1 Tax=Olsenella sp. Marseille-P4559 TaxID=2364795 RepID=UPI0010304169|nr:hypothetical protein [Olsenella sp. Marseille-P4559]